MVERVHQLGGVLDARRNGDKSAEVSTKRNMKVCVWCSRNNRESCETVCQPEGKYRLLDPVIPDHWEMPPSPPAFREMVDMPAAERLAFLWLVVYYLDRESKRE